jgi:hypothetical protein
MACRVAVRGGVHGLQRQQQRRSAGPETAHRRGDLIREATLRASYSPAGLLALASSGEVSQAILEQVPSTDCRISVYHFERRTVDPAGHLTPASGALMVPNDSATARLGERPIVPYAHGTNTNKAYDPSDLESPNNAEALPVAGLPAADARIVVAPNYVGCDTSTIGYHPYLCGDQQSKDMIDAMSAARSALPFADAPETTDGGKVPIAGHSQGGCVAGDASGAATCGRERDGVRADVGPVRAVRGPDRDRLAGRRADFDAAGQPAPLLRRLRHGPNEVIVGLCRRIEQSPLRWRTSPRPPGGIGLRHFGIQVGEDLLDDLGVLDARDEVQGRADTASAGCARAAIRTAPPQAGPKGEGQDARSHPATLPSPTSNGSSHAGSVRNVNTLRPSCGPTAMR